MYYSHILGIRLTAICHVIHIHGDQITPYLRFCATLAARLATPETL